MLIKGQRTHMVRFKQEHLEHSAYYAWLHDLDVVRYIGRSELLAGITFSAMEDYVKQLWANDNCYFLAVYHSESETFIGTAKINFSNRHGRQMGVGDVGIMLGDRSFWRQGLATDVLRAVSIFAFDKLDARKLSAGAMSPNAAIVRAFLRIGYAEEGRLRQHLPIEGGYCDHVLLGCFKGELN